MALAKPEVSRSRKRSVTIANNMIRYATKAKVIMMYQTTSQNDIAASFLRARSRSPQLWRLPGTWSSPLRDDLSDGGTIGRATARKDATPRRDLDGHDAVWRNGSYSEARRRASERRSAAAMTAGACMRPGCRESRSIGPETDTAAITLAEGERTGAETEATPCSRSPTLCAQPRRRTPASAAALKLAL